MTTPSLPLDIDSVKGFLDPQEGQALLSAALRVADLGPVMEIGSYCGKSTVYLGTAAKHSDNILYAVDHHRGSEEHQFGEEYFDSEVYDTDISAVDTFKLFRQTVDRAQLQDVVVPLVAATKIASKHWATPLGMLFIDGGHSEQAALDDYRCWTPFIRQGGLLAIHDIFPNPEEGGQAPYHIYQLALNSGQFELVSMTKTLGLLRRL